MCRHADRAVPLLLLAGHHGRLPIRAGPSLLLRWLVPPVIEAPASSFCLDACLCRSFDCSAAHSFVVAVGALVVLCLRLPVVAHRYFVVLCLAVRGCGTAQRRLHAAGHRLHRVRQSFFIGSGLCLGWLMVPIRSSTWSCSTLSTRPRSRLAELF